MAIQFPCPQCGHTIKVKSEHAGEDGRCPKCKAPVHVPEASRTNSSPQSDDEFDPVAILNEEPADAVKVAVPAGVAADAEVSAARGTKGKPTKAAASDAPSAAADFWDQAQAAREMRKALKASVKQAKEKRDNPVAGIQIELRDIIRDVGPKLIGGLLLLSFISYGLYWMFDSMMGGGIKLPKLGKVTGVVSVNGEPLGNATVYFSPMETEFLDGRSDRARTSVGLTDSSGRYTMMYMEKIEGVAVGNCRVWIECMGPDGRSLVPPDYSQGAMQTREVMSGTQKVDFPMLIRLPAAKKK